MILKRNRLKYTVVLISIILLVTLFYNEYLIFELQKLKWVSYECPKCVTILLVADPQILGEKLETHFASWLAIWDSDRYIKKTFSRALEFSQPHVVVFLGDLMDEGHISDAVTFERYKRRLDSIFSMPDDIMKIYLPGDNDIGGEEDRVSPVIYKRFNFAYSQPDTLVYKTVTFFKVNRLTCTMPETLRDAVPNNSSEKNMTTVVLSHMPLMGTPGRIVENVLKELKPDIIFAGHLHKAMHSSLDTSTDQSNISFWYPQTGTPMYHAKLDVGLFYEMEVPTCSYRMGTPYIGYGLAYINTQEKAYEFTFLWTPNRFDQLFGYIYIGILILIIVYFQASM